MFKCKVCLLIRMDFEWKCCSKQPAASATSYQITNGWIIFASFTFVNGAFFFLLSFLSSSFFLHTFRYNIIKWPRETNERHFMQTGNQVNGTNKFTFMFFYMQTSSSSCCNFFFLLGMATTIFVSVHTPNMLI